MTNLMQYVREAPRDWGGRIVETMFERPFARDFGHMLQAGGKSQVGRRGGRTVAGLGGRPWSCRRC